ncbi:MAG: hypothetical protein JW747_03170 [Candidatus Aminicenantes bacterium]|nr:hypothetical protein [Candidatus Aminicenantes bacterium]
MDADFERLIELQELDIEIRKVLSLLNAIPAQVESIDRKIETAAQTLGRARDRLAQNQKKRRDLEGEVKDVKAQISKYKLQLNQVKTNREYQSLLKEIDEHQQNIDRLEEEIIGELLNADQIEADIHAAVERDREDQSRFDQEKAALAREKEYWEGQVRELEARRKQILPQIPAEQTALYERISLRMGGQALSPVTDDFCTLCHMRIRPQMLSELIEKNEILLCENCGRILYWVKKKDEAEKDASGRL